MLTFVLGQFEDTDTYSEEHTLSASLLVLLMVETLQTSLPSSFLQRVLAVDSPILQFRYSASQKVCAAYMVMSGQCAVQTVCCGRAEGIWPWATTGGLVNAVQCAQSVHCVHLSS